MTKETKQNYPVLDGGDISFHAAVSTGFSVSSNGDGSMDISLCRTGEPYKYIDLGVVRFGDISQLYGNPFADLKRRLSFKQAEIIKDLFVKTLEHVFQGRIPSDAEIYEFRRLNPHVRIWDWNKLPKSQSHGQSEDPV